MRPMAHSISSTRRSVPASAAKQSSESSASTASFRVDEKALTSRNGVEFKVTIDPSQAAAVRKLLDLKDGKAERTRVRFYDTPRLDLFKQGVVLRTRKATSSRYPFWGPWSHASGRPSRTTARVR